MNSDNLESERILESLKRTEARLLTFAENSSDILWETDAAGAYSFSSPNVSAILGYEAEEMLGKTPFDFMPPEEAVRVAEKLAEYISERKPFVIEHEICSRCGEIRSMECSGVPIIDGDKRLTGYRGIDRDITERKKLERQLRVAQKMEAIGNLAGGIAHDFNNILSVISGYCDLLSSKSSPAEIETGIEAMKKAAKRAVSLTQQLLVLARR